MVDPQIRRTQLQEDLTRGRDHLGQLQHQVVALSQQLLRLEGAIAALDEVLAPDEPPVPAPDNGVPQALAPAP